MAITINPFLLTDGYKLSHREQYPDNTQYVYSNWTARGSRINDVEHVVFFGLQYALTKLKEEWDEGFFNRPLDDVKSEIHNFVKSYIGPGYNLDHVVALHELGHLPLEFKALPEGTKVPLRVPMFTVENTDPRFAWFTNFIETSLSARLWMPCTSATLSVRVRNLLDHFALKTTGSTAAVPFQNHDFSMRGMAGIEAAIISGMGHLVASTGSDSLPAVAAVAKYYPTDSFIGGGVPATEHSVMCAGGQENEFETFDRLLDLYPSGIVSVVSDAWDYWGVLTEILPALKDKIMARDGKLVIRPDSGNPADIICGVEPQLFDKWAGATAVERKGSIEILWDLFGGTINEQGYKELDPHIGLIYGDSMNFGRIEDICERLEDKGFASTNVVFGTGSYTYQYQTRDTFMFAIKATNVVIDGVERAIFKEPKTDSGMKKSLKGRVIVFKDENGELEVDDEVYPWEYEVMGDFNLLQTVWKDGEFHKIVSFDEVRERALA